MEGPYENPSTICWICRHRSRRGFTRSYPANAIGALESGGRAGWATLFCCMGGVGARLVAGARIASNDAHAWWRARFLRGPFHCVFGWSWSQRDFGVVRIWSRNDDDLDYSYSSAAGCERGELDGDGDGAAQFDMGCRRCSLSNPCRTCVVAWLHPTLIVVHGRFLCAAGCLGGD